MHSVSQYQAIISDHINGLDLTKEPQNLYAPITYMLSLGGKRLRPVLTLMTAEIFGVSHKKALDAALAIEVFHNFSLIHDDIMDDAPLRRGQATVHEKWDLNTGILSGDAMLIMAYRLFESYDSETFKSLITLFSKTALEVCEGQQQDVDFETRDDVTIPEYLNMIACKTAVLVGAAMEMGAIVANASETDRDLMYQFGKNLGIAFQLQDDYLDVFGDPKTFGKQTGGDIIENKKTFLYLKSLELSNAEDRLQLQHLYDIEPHHPSDKIETVQQLFLSSGAAQATQEEIKKYTDMAFSILQKTGIPNEKKALLIQFGTDLMNRTV